MFNVLSAGKQTKSTLEKWDFPSFDQAETGSDAGDGPVGFNEGFEQGQQEARQLLTADAERVQQLLRALTAPAELFSAEIRDELLTTAFAVAKVILQREVSQSPEDFKVLVDEAVAALPLAQGEVEIALNPEDMKLLQEALVNTGEQDEQGIIADAAVPRGSCRVKRGPSVVHGGVDGLIQQLASKHIA